MSHAKVILNVMHLTTQQAASEQNLNVCIWGDGSAKKKNKQVAYCWRIVAEKIKKWA